MKFNRHLYDRHLKESLELMKSITQEFSNPEYQKIVNGIEEYVTELQSRIEYFREEEDIHLTRGDKYLGQLRSFTADAYESSLLFLSKCLPKTKSLEVNSKK